MSTEIEDTESGMLSLPYSHFSPALSHLSEERSDSVNTLCAHCKNACWIATEQDLYCHCRVLFEKVWTLGRASTVLACDGALLIDE